MRTNTVKAKLAQGKLSIGGTISFYSPQLVELMGALGMEWVFIDGEHGCMSESEVEQMVRAAELFGMAPIVRVLENRPTTILRILDVGAQGIVVPHVDTQEQAEAAVRAAKYWPLGERGSNYGTGRNNQYGIGQKDVREYFAASNKETMVIALIESGTAVKNVEAIATTVGIDATWLGPSDMAQSMGMPPQAEVEVALDYVVQTTVRAGKTAAVTHLPVTSFERLAQFVQMGARMIGFSPLGFMLQGVPEYAKRIRELAPS